MIKQEKITLESGKNFLVHKWSMTKCFAELPHFTLVLGHPISQLFKSADVGDETGANIFDNLPDLVYLLSANLQEHSAVNLINKLLEGTLMYPEGSSANPQPVKIDEFEDMAEVLELCASVFKIHFGSLFKKGFERSVTHDVRDGSIKQLIKKIERTTSLDWQHSFMFHLLFHEKNKGIYTRSCLNQITLDEAMALAEQFEIYDAVEDEYRKIEQRESNKKSPF